MGKQKNKRQGHYTTLNKKLQAAGIKLFAKNRVNFRPAEKREITRTVNRLGDFIVNRSRYTSSAKITAAQYKTMNQTDVDQSIFPAIKTGRNEYRVFTASRFQQKENISVKWETATDSRDGAKYRKLVVTKKPKNKKSDIPATTMQFYPDAYKSLGGEIEKLAILERAKEIFDAGMAVRVIVNGDGWSKVYNTYEQLEEYLNEIERRDGSTVFLSMEVVAVDRAQKMLAGRRRRHASKTLRSKEFDE